MNLIKKYRNGNCDISIYDDGTKTREYEGKSLVDFPESIDVKITNYCDMYNVCKWCHEKSNMRGKHGDLEDALGVLSVLPAGVELAIGGGNPLSHPKLEYFLIELKKQGIIANITVNAKHLKAHKEQLTQLIKGDLVNGVGISYSGKVTDELKYFCEMTDNVVIHVIMGVDHLNCLEEIGKVCKKVLILGYKNFGKGVNFHSKQVEDKIYKWFIHLPQYFGELILSFDNLAIEQLKLKRFFPQDEWEKFFMGEDGKHTCYLDCIKQEFAVSSTISKRKSVEGFDAISLFKEVQKMKNN